MTIAAAISGADRDATVVREGRKLAERLGEPLFVVLVMESADFVEYERANIEETGRVKDRTDVEAMARAFASDIADDALDGDFEYEVRAFIGDPVEELSNFADANEVEYLVIGGRKRSPIGKLVFGSTAQSILLNYDRPIVSVKSEPP